MASYTAMSAEAMRAIVHAQKDAGEKYPMELNRTDFRGLIYALWAAYDSSNATDGLKEWIAEFVGSIGETLGVEQV